MSVDMFWKRVPAGVVAECGPKELLDLVPYFSDDRYEVERDNGTLVAAVDTGALIHTLFLTGATSASGKAAVRAFAQEPSGWDEDYMVGTISPDVVRQVSAFLSDARLDQWVTEHRAALADEARSLGYHRPFDDAWAGHLLADARDLAALFGAAAQADEVIIVRISA